VVRRRTPFRHFYGSSAALLNDKGVARGIGHVRTVHVANAVDLIPAGTDAGIHGDRPRPHRSGARIAVAAAGQFPVGCPLAHLSRLALSEDAKPVVRVGRTGLVGDFDRLSKGVAFFRNEDFIHAIFRVIAARKLTRRIRIHIAGEDHLINHMNYAIAGIDIRRHDLGQDINIPRCGLIEVTVVAQGRCDFHIRHRYRCIANEICRKNFALNNMGHDNIAQKFRILDGVIEGHREFLKGGIAWGEDGKRTWPCDCVADGFQSIRGARLGSQGT
jgi:hypothetical protein